MARGRGGQHFSRGRRFARAVLGNALASSFPQVSTTSAFVGRCQALRHFQGSEVRHLLGCRCAAHTLVALREAAKALEQFDVGLCNFHQLAEEAAKQLGELPGVGVGSLGPQDGSVRVKLPRVSKRGFARANNGGRDSKCGARAMREKAKQSNLSYIARELVEKLAARLLGFHVFRVQERHVGEHSLDRRELVVRF